MASTVAARVIRVSPSRVMVGAYRVKLMTP